MKLWMSEERAYANEGDTRWLVEWYQRPAGFTEEQWADQWEQFGPDALDSRVRNFGKNGKGLAVTFAEKMLKDKTSYLGCSMVKKQVAVFAFSDPHGVGDWEEDRKSVV